MLKIALIEFDYHAEVLRNSLHIHQAAGFHTLVFTDQRIWKKVNWTAGLEGIELHIQTEKHSFSAYLEEKAALINSADLILFSTIASRFKHWNRFDFQKPLALRIHNANAYFRPFRETYRPIFKAFFLWKDFSHFVRKSIGQWESIRRARFMKKVDHFIFPSEKIASHSIKAFKLPPVKVSALPFVFWEKAAPPVDPQRGELHLAVLGKVDQRNRDYESLCEALELLQPQLARSKRRLQLSLLGPSGSAYGRSIVKRLQKLISPNFELRSFPAYVPQTDFEAVLSQCDFFIIPARIDTRFTIYKERYGYTKISGNINDVIRFHRFALITADYPRDQNLHAVLSPYQNPADLAAQILQQFDSRAYQEIDFTKALAPYSLDNMAQLYQNAFERIIQQP